MSKSIIEALYEYFNDSPLLDMKRLNVDYLPESTKRAGIEYSVSIIPTDEVIKQYVDGSTKCRCPFTVSSINSYGQDVCQNLENAGLSEQMSNWIREKASRREYPELPDGLSALSMRAIGSGYLFEADVDNGKYQLQCEMIFYRKGENR